MMPSKKKRFNARFPPARIKKIMQKDEEVGKVAQAVPVIIGKALESFAERLLTTAAEVTRGRNARTLTPNHIKQAVLTEPEFQFLRELSQSIPDVNSIGEEPELSSSSALPTPTTTTAFDINDKNNGGGGTSAVPAVETEVGPFTMASTAVSSSAVISATSFSLYQPARKMVGILPLATQLPPTQVTNHNNNNHQKTPRSRGRPRKNPLAAGPSTSAPKPAVAAPKNGGGSRGGGRTASTGRRRKRKYGYEDDDDDDDDDEDFYIDENSVEEEAEEETTAMTAEVDDEETEDDNTEDEEKEQKDGEAASKKFQKEPAHATEGTLTTITTTTSQPAECNDEDDYDNC